MRYWRLEIRSVMAILLAGLAACTDNSAAIIADTCVSDNVARSVCECQADVLEGDLRPQDFKQMASFMAGKDRQGLSRLMREIGRDHPAETSRMMQGFAKCEGPGARVKPWPKG